MSLNTMIKFPPGRSMPDHNRDVTRRRVVAQMRDSHTDPCLPVDWCLTEYERMAKRDCREYIATLAELGAFTSVQGLRTFIDQAIIERKLK